MTESRQQSNGSALNVKFSEVANEDYSTNSQPKPNIDPVIKPIGKLDEDMHLDTLRPSLNKRVSVR